MPFMTGIILIGLGIQADNFAGWFGVGLGILHLWAGIVVERSK